MRMKELSDTTGVPVATIKFYLRERLLPAGDRTAPNQSDYTDAHLRRLRLIRALLDVGGLSVAAARAVTSVLDLPGRSVHEVLGLVQHAISPVSSPPDTAEFAAARATVDDLIETLGWHVYPGNPGRDGAAAVLVAMADLGQNHLTAALEPYARACELAAQADLTAVAAAGDRDSMVESAVIGMVFGETLIVHLRRLAQEHVSAQRISHPTTLHRSISHPTQVQPSVEETDVH